MIPYRLGSRVLLLLPMMMLPRFSRRVVARAFSSFAHRNNHRELYSKSRDIREISSSVSPTANVCFTEKWTYLHSSRQQFGSESSHILANLNPSQIEAVTQPLKAITRVVAGPGSGKTKVLTCRIAHLLQNDPRSRILGVTFTRKAAGEMQNRLLSLLEAQTAETSVEDDEEVIEQDIDGRRVQQSGIERVTLGTFHSVCSKILRWNGELLATLPTVVKDMVGSVNGTNLDGGFNIVDQAEQIRIVKQCFEEKGVSLKDLDMKPLQILQTIAQCKAMFAEGKNPFQNEQNTHKSMRVASTIYSQYKEKLYASNCVDFDDLIYLTRELLIEYPEVRDRLQSRWTHVLVDEFQDTSRSQMDLVKLLTSDSLFIVGDADQSIYSWRGAHAGSFTEFVKEFESHHVDVRTVYLMENYRSTANIVRAAQKVINSRSKEDSGADRLRQDMKPVRGSGVPPRIVASGDDKAEADFVVRTVKENLDKGIYGLDHSVAFIYRTNAQSRALEEACVKANLPYVIFGSATSFYKRQEIKDCLSYLRWINNGRDRSSMLRSLAAPKRGIGDRAIQEFDEYCLALDAHFATHLPGSQSPSPLDVLLSLSDGVILGGEGSPDPKEYISARPMKLFRVFSLQMRRIVDTAYSEPVDALVAFVINEVDFPDHLDKISKSNSEYEERLANVQELRQAARRYANDGAAMSRDNVDEMEQPPLTNFLDDVALVTEMSEHSSEERFVANLMTIHASKGMEFDTVFVVGVEDGTLPTSQALNEGEGSVEYEEEKRLCYVAMTRAKTELVLSWRKEVPIFTATGVRMTERNRSRFLDPLVSGSKSKSSGKEAPRRTSDAVHSTHNAFTKLPPLPAASRSRSDGLSKRSSSTFSGSNPSKTWDESFQPSKRNPTSFDSPKRKSYDGTNSIYSKVRHTIASTAQGRSQAVQEQRRESARAADTRPTSAFDTGRRSNQGGTKSVYSTAPSVSPGERRFREQRTLGADPPSANAHRRKPSMSNDVQGAMDSTWFFPVGTEVMHKYHGRGIVLPPPPPKTKDELPVLVKFPDGQSRAFCARGDDLTPIV